MNLQTSPAPITCPQCSQPIAPPTPGTETHLTCPGCAAEFEIYLFAEPIGTESPPAASKPASEGEATCFFHDDRLAERSCDQCGRFVCSVCDLELGGRHLCPSCIEAAMKPGSTSFVRGRARWDWIAFLVGVSPLLGGIFFWWALPITGAAAIFLSVLSFRKPPSLVTGHRPIIAISGGIFGLLQIAPFVALIWFLIAVL